MPQAPPTGPEQGLHLAVALDGAGWHPAAWREPAARPAEFFTAGYWADLAAEAERGLLDFITIEDALGLQSANRFTGIDDRTDQVRGRLDAVLIAARIAPLTRHIGLVPTGTTTHTDPFHVSTALATLDYVSGGRAGWRAQLSSQPEQARHFGHRELPPLSSVLPAPANPATPAALPTPRQSRGCASDSAWAPTSSRWSAGCGTPGRTTRSSTMSPRGGSSTATSCTTSTSRASGSA
ncbi:MAG TPA: LLM class flavin-dependent oxidoreductase, partial [Trebonia sp.]